MTKTILDVGNAHAGILLTYKDGQFTVLSHGKNDRREVVHDDPIDAAAELFNQARILRLATRVMDQCLKLNPGATRPFADYLEEVARDAG